MASTATAEPNGSFIVNGFEPVTHHDNSQDNRQLFFAKVSKTAGEDEIKALFSEYGTVQDVIIFQSSQGSMTSKGCGLVTMNTHAEAASAIQGLHGKFAWSNRDPPMVVTWMDAALQDPARQQHMNAAKLGQKLPVGRQASSSSDALGSGNDPGSADLPPAGCEPDAIKLFVGNIPMSYTEEQLLPIFQNIGPVVELVVVRNKQSSQSKGCAFVWFASRAHAEDAISKLNLKHVLADATGHQNRPLVVRKARTGHIAQLGKNGAGFVIDSVLDAGPPQLRHNLGARLQHHIVMQPGLVVGGAATMSQPLLSPTASLGGLGQRIIGSSGLLTNAMVPPAQSAPTLTAAVGPNSSMSLRLPPSLPSVSHGSFNNNLAQTLAAASQHHAMALGSQGTLNNHSVITSQTLWNASQNVGSQQNVLGQQLDLQPITVHSLPGGGTLVSQPGLGAMQAVLGSNGQPAYQLVVDMGPQSTYDLQRVAVPDDQWDPYVSVPQLQAVHVAPQTVEQVYSHGSVMRMDALQLSIVNDHLYTIQARTGAQLMISPGGPGTFNLLLSGNQQQVEQARLLVASLLSNPNQP